MYGYEQSANGGYPGDPYQQAGQAGMGGMYGQQGYGAPSGGAAGYEQQQSAAHSLYPEPSPPSLSDAVRAFTTGSMTVEDFQAIFITSKVHCPRGDRPGFLALHNTPTPVIPMFSSVKELRRYAGKESKYFTVSGAEVLDLLPTGYGFALDMEGEHRMVFDARAVEQMVDFTMRRMYG
ncbi:SseB family protein [Kitasatospora sp. LaBMicrA B282]|uniref:SseB family protein n=1 Tax=Kitasatospora sp. LaBMicrA B282 TaxID=3420949 RepID=UPI003D09AAC0